MIVGKLGIFYRPDYLISGDYPERVFKSFKSDWDSIRKESYRCLLSHFKAFHLNNRIKQWGIITSVKKNNEIIARPERTRDLINSLFLRANRGKY